MSDVMMSDNSVPDPPSAKKLRELQSAAPVILPSILQCDFTNLRREIERLEAAGAQALHLDVMDGHFVPNLSFGPLMVEAVRGLTDLPLDTHLMISNPDQYIENYVSAGADFLSVHVEAMADIGPVLEQIRAAGAQAGLAFNPPTPVEKIEPLLSQCDYVLVMSVMPGFGGQSFDPVALEKLAKLREIVGPKMPLEVDGGVNEQTIKQCAEAGANLMVVGSAILGQQDYTQTIARLDGLARSA